MFLTFLVRLLLNVGGHLGGGPEVLVQLFNGHLVVEPDRGVLHHLDGLHDIAGGLVGGVCHVGHVGELLLDSLDLLHAEPGLILVLFL